MESVPKSAFQKLRQRLYSRKKPNKEKSLSSSFSSSLPSNPNGFSPKSTKPTTNCIDLRRVFDYFDENRDGKISPAELQNCVKTVGGELSIEEAEAAVRCSDVDGDGFLGIEEFEQLMESSGEDDKASELKEAFEMYVMEGSDGFITPASLKKMLSRLGESKSIDDCKAMIRVFDLNGDGVLSFDEFRVMMR